MFNKDAIEQFYKDLESLGLKNPVTEIHEATKYNKGTISIYLNRKDEPSKNFLKAFYNKFGDSLKNGAVRPQEAQQSPDYRDDMIAYLKEKINLNERKQLVMLRQNQALLKAIVETLPKLVSKLEKISILEATEEMRKRSEHHLDVLEKENI